MKKDLDFAHSALSEERFIEEELWKLSLAAIFHHRPFLPDCKNSANIATALERMKILDAEYLRFSSEEFRKAALTLALSAHAPFLDQESSEKLGNARKLMIKTIQESALSELIEERHLNSRSNVFFEMFADTLVFAEWLTEVNFSHLEEEFLDSALQESVLFAPHQYFHIKEIPPRVQHS